MIDIFEKNVEVSVCVVTYNQEAYIGECLQSLVEQDCDFKFEIIVSDDSSTDGTSEIVKKYADKYPDIIKATVHKKNIGAFQNFIFVHEQAVGLYVAHMDGDDYALPDKLKLQKIFLDIHSECAMVFHRCMSLRSDGNLIASSKNFNIKDSCNFAEFIYRYPNSSWHSSKMYRRSANHHVDRKNKNFLDKHIHFEHGLSGLVGFINHDLAVYRVGVGISSNIYAIQDLALDAYAYAIQLGYDEHLMKKIIAREHFEQGLRALQLENFISFKENVKIGFESGYQSGSASLAYYLRDYPRIYMRVRNGIRWYLNKFVR